MRARRRYGKRAAMSIPLPLPSKFQIKPRRLARARLPKIKNMCVNSCRSIQLGELVDNALNIRDDSSWSSFRPMEVELTPAAISARLASRQITSCLAVLSIAVAIF